PIRLAICTEHPLATADADAQGVLWVNSVPLGHVGVQRGFASSFFSAFGAETLGDGNEVSTMCEIECNALGAHCERINRAIEACNSALFYVTNTVLAQDAVERTGLVAGDRTDIFAAVMDLCVGCALLLKNPVCLVRSPFAVVFTLANSGRTSTRI